MVTAIVLLKVERSEVENVAQQLVVLDGVTEVFSVAGRIDLVALLRGASNEAIGHLVTKEIRGISGITETETLMAFRVFSDYDLERMFSIGINS